jgi:predicted nucleotidyltransferase
VSDFSAVLPPRQTLRDVAAWFAAAGVRWVLIGGVASAFLGRPRVTKDVDVVVLAGNEDIKHLLAVGATHGFSPRLSDSAALARERRVLLVDHQPSGVGVDVSLGVLPFEKEMVARATQAEIAGIALPLPSREDLIIMKAVAHRPIDLHDIDGILDVHPNVDAKRIRYWVGEFARVLEMPEILADVHAILTRHRRRPAKRRPSAKRSKSSRGG